MSRPQITIQGEIHSSKNSRRIFRNPKTGSPFIAKSKLSMADEKTMAYQLLEQLETWKTMVCGKQYPLNVVFRFRRATRRPFDYVNIAQGVLDAMVKNGYMPDDNMNYVIPSFVPYVLDKNNPGCDVFIG